MLSRTHAASRVFGRYAAWRGGSSLQCVRRVRATTFLSLLADVPDCSVLAPRGARCDGRWEGLCGYVVWVVGIIQVASTTAGVAAPRADPLSPSANEVRTLGWWPIRHRLSLVECQIPRRCSGSMVVFCTNIVPLARLCLNPFV